MRAARIVLACALLTAGCTPRHDDTLVLGAIYPLSGAQGPYGTEEFRGAETAVRIVDARGGIVGRPVRLEAVDAPTVDDAWNGAYRLARMGVPAILGSYGSTLSLAASEAAHREGVLYWETGAVADLVTARGYPEVFRMGPSGATLAARAAAFASDVVAPRYRIPARALRVAVVYEDDPYGSSVGEGIRRESRRRGFRLVASHPYDPATEGFVGIVRSLRRARPDVVVAASYLSDGARFRRAVLRARLPMKALIGKCAAFFTPEMARLLGPDINGVFVADKPEHIGAPALLPEARALEREFRADFTTRYGHAPRAAAYMGFCGAWTLLAHVLPAARSTSVADLRAAALALDLPDGSLPNGAGVRFARAGRMAGQNMRALGVVWQWQHNKPVLVYPPVAARGTPRF